MKIGFFVHNCPPEFLGGTELVVLALARALAASGDEVFVVAGSAEFVEGGSIEEECYEGIRVLRVRRDPSETYDITLEYPITGNILTELLMDEIPDAVHVHHWSTLGADILQRVTALGIPAGVTLHDYWTTCPRFFRTPIQGVRCPADEQRDSCVTCIAPERGDDSAETVAGAFATRDALILRELELARFIAVPSQAMRRLLCRYLGLEKPIEVVPHGLLRGVDERAEARPESATIRVGTFGNITPAKGLHLLVEAVAHIGARIELRVSGHTTDEAYLERLRERAGALGVEFRYTGPYEPEDRHPALDLDLAVFPSTCQESYGLVVDEALARGVPVVVSSNGALPERAQKGGVVVRSGGVMPLRVTLSGLLRSRARLDALRDEVPTDFLRIEDAAVAYRKLLDPEEVPA